MKRTFRSPIVFLLTGLVIGALTCSFAAEGNGHAAIQRVVAMRWGQGKKYGSQVPYGAEVYLEPALAPDSPMRCLVCARVWIGRGNDYWNDLGELGVVDDPLQATERYGELDWNDVGLTIGPGDPAPRVFEWKRIESHR
jgi:hypothetical protein